MDIDPPYGGPFISNDISWYPNFVDDVKYETLKRKVYIGPGAKSIADRPNWNTDTSLDSQLVRGVDVIKSKLCFLDVGTFIDVQDAEQLFLLVVIRLVRIIVLPKLYLVEKLSIETIGME